MTNLKDFRDRATEQEQDALAEFVGTTKDYLFNQLGIHRKVPVRKAASIEAATAGIAALNGGKTPIVYRDMVCETCATCPLACASRSERGE